LKSSRYVIQLINLPEALSRIHALVSPVRGSESITLTSSCGRILFEDQIATMDLPPFANSAMDGYALRTASLSASPPSALRCVGESLAGHPYSGHIRKGECIRITTGAVMPADADCVVAQEDCSIQEDRVLINIRVSPGANVRNAGNDIASGTRLLPAGTKLNAFDLALLAAAGISQVTVKTVPRIAVFSSGDELQEPGTVLGPGQIYDSNRYALLQLLEKLPVAVTDMGVLPDDPQSILEQLAAAATSHDLLLTSGGVSVGPADYLKAAITQLGSLDLWRLNLKPGKPLAVGRINNALFIGLPGNPVSTIVTFLLIAKPVIFALSGSEDTMPPVSFDVPLNQDLQHSPGREEYQRGRLRISDQRLVVEVTGDQSSNRLATFSGAHCLIRVPADSGDLKTGTMVTVLPFNGLLN
jgi:molybdopterin molybdotransferase